MKHVYDNILRREFKEVYVEGMFKRRNVGDSSVLIVLSPISVHIKLRKVLRKH